MKTRLQYIVNNEGLSNNRFAAEIGVSPAAVTHIISGRNNPSLDIIAKIATRYPEYSLRWLVLGELPIMNEKPSMANYTPIEDTSHEATKTTTEPSLFSSNNSSNILDYSPQDNAGNSNDEMEFANSVHTSSPSAESTRDYNNYGQQTPSDRLIVCLPDGTFEEYTRRK